MEQLDKDKQRWWKSWLPDWQDVLDIVPAAVNFVKNQLIYMTGRGLLGSAIVLGGFASNIANPISLISSISIGLVVAATVGLQAYNNYRNERFQEGQMLHAFRDEIGAVLDKSPEDATLDDLKLLGQGSRNKGIPRNPIIQQALDHNSKKHLLQIITTAFAGFTTLALLLGFPPIIEQVGIWHNTTFGASQFVGVTGLMLASGAGMGLLNRSYDYIGERIFDFNQAPAYDVIRGIARQLNRGRDVDVTQVFEAYVAADLSLAHAIKERFDKAYGEMSYEEQQRAIAEYGNKRELDKVTRDLNGRHIQPEELAFTIAGQRSGVPRVDDPEQKEEIDPVKKLVKEVRKELGVPVSQQVSQETTEEQEPEVKGGKRFEPTSGANDNIPGFAKCFTPRTGDEAKHKTHLERLCDERRTTSLSSPEKASHLERELAKALTAEYEDKVR